MHIRFVFFSNRKSNQVGSKMNFFTTGLSILNRLSQTIKGCPLKQARPPRVVPPSLKAKTFEKKLLNDSAS